MSKAYEICILNKRNIIELSKIGDKISNQLKGLSESETQLLLVINNKEFMKCFKRTTFTYTMQNLQKIKPHQVNST